MSFLCDSFPYLFSDAFARQLLLVCLHSFPCPMFFSLCSLSHHRLFLLLVFVVSEFILFSPFCGVDRRPFPSFVVNGRSAVHSKPTSRFPPIDPSLFPSYKFVFFILANRFSFSWLDGCPQYREPVFFKASQTFPPPFTTFPLTIPFKTVLQRLLCGKA